MRRPHVRKKVTVPKVCNTSLRTGLRVLAPLAVPVPIAPDLGHRDTRQTVMGIPELGSRLFVQVCRQKLPKCEFGKPANSEDLVRRLPHSTHQSVSTDPNKSQIVATPMVDLAGSPQPPPISFAAVAVSPAAYKEVGKCAEAPRTRPEKAPLHPGCTPLAERSTPPGLTPRLRRSHTYERNESA